MPATILVVDDDPSINQLLADILTEEGFEVTTARHGADALQLLEDPVPAAIVLDLNMPVMDGRTFYRQLRAHQREEVASVPVLLLTAYGASTARRELGVEAAIGKPFDIDHLVEVLKRIVEGRLEQ